MELREIHRKVEDEKMIHCKMIFEIAGKPEKFVNKTVTDQIKKIKEENVEVIKHQAHPAKKVEGVKDFWSTFAEVDFLAPNMMTIQGLIFDYMPSSLEILAPEDKIIDSVNNYTDILNDLIAKLHMYDNAFKHLQAENFVLKKRAGIDPGKPLDPTLSTAPREQEK